MRNMGDHIRSAVDQKLVTVKKHPTVDLFIYNYSPVCQYDKIWNDVTMQCRGLILDNEFKVHGRPFKKFFNYSELQPQDVPNEPFEAYTKMDGSLGILYWIDDVPHIATRGSFESEQAVKGTDILHSKYGHLFEKLKRDRTYLFEIIYPENRIVVDYGDMEDLVMLAVIDNGTGNDLPLGDIGFPVVERHDGIKDVEALRAMESENEEGFVIKFKSGFRCKLKFSEYVRLHKILTQTSNIAIWEYLRDGKPLDEILERIPDEFYKWVRKTKEDLETSYANIESRSRIAYEGIINGIKRKDMDRKTFALEVMKYHKDISGILFNMHDNKEYSPIIWKMIRPEYSKPFKNDIES